MLKLNLKVNTSEWIFYESKVLNVGNNPKKISFLPWGQGQPNGEFIDQNCIILMAESSTYYDESCDDKYWFQFYQSFFLNKRSKKLDHFEAEFTCPFENCLFFWKNRIDQCLVKLVKGFRVPWKEILSSN
jgi:hypothetical protein